MPLPPAERLAVILRNPAARRAIHRERLEAAIRVVTPDGWRIEIRDPVSRDDARRLAAEAARSGAAAILASGGDGTLNLVLDALAEAGLAGGVEVGVVPAGTANVWAHEAGTPLDPEGALALLGTGHRARADLGVLRIGDGPARRFLLMCSAGLDARVVGEVERRARWKRRIGRAAFLAPALGALVSAPPFDMSIEVTSNGATTEQRETLYEALAGNSRLYGGVGRPASGALMDDGALDLVTLAAPRGTPGRLRAVGLAARALLGGLDRDRPRGIDYLRGDRIVLRPSAEVAVQVDGEYAGVATPDAPLTLTVEPHAATLIVGRRARRLFLHW